MKLRLQTWRLKVRGCLGEVKEIDATQVSSYRECAIGKWIYSTGMDEYGQLPELRELERKHQQMHLMAKEVVDMKRLGRMEEAEREFTKVRGVVEEVADLIDSVEKQVP